MKLSHPTLTQFVLDQENTHGGTGELSHILLDLGVVGKILSREMNRAGLTAFLGGADSENSSGDDVQKLDIVANDLCIEFLQGTGHFAALASEEEEGIVCLDEKGKYVIAFDPIDGSSNIDYNIPVGTIFSIHKRISDSGPVTEADFLQAGSTQVAAGYIVYGSSSILVYTAGQGVHGFTLDQSIGEWLLSHESIRFPEECNVYSANEAYAKTWDDVSRTFLEEFKARPESTSRHVGSLLADLHRNLLKGGMHFRPLDDAATGKAKLRLNYETKAMAMIVEQAGGYATDGMQRILDIVPTDLHQKSAFVAGNASIVREYEKRFRAQ
jgi:fructose-1,6-bisphosphatase I